jgi:phosphoribosylaminoimidazole (AIR) synthetase
MAIVIDRNDAQAIISTLETAGESASIIGTIAPALNAAADAEVEYY